MAGTKLRTMILLAAFALLATLGLAGAGADDKGEIIPFTIRVPADAKVFIEGYKTEATGTERSFKTIPLAPGWRYDYTVKVLADGKEVTRTITLAPGMDNTFDLRAAFLPVAKNKVGSQPSAKTGQIEGKVMGAGKPISGSLVTLYAASEGAPMRLVLAKTGEDGSFKMTVDPTAPSLQGKVLYLTAIGGTPKAAADKGPNDAIALLSVLGTKLPNTVTVNELTTVASAFTNARFINGDAISGKPLGLKIAAGNVPNLVNLKTGGWGKVIVNPGNSTWTTSLANLNTLGSLITASFTVANDDWRARFFKAATATDGATPKNTLEAMAGIARTPWANPKVLYALFDEAYPQPKDGGRRKAPFLPYLAYTPADFTLSLWFGGGGSYSNGNMVFDAEGNMWCGQNWMAGSQSGVRKNIGGGVVKFSPNGTALSPPITGFTAEGIVDGIGWGTGVTLDKVWLAGFNGPVAVMDFEGRPLAKESDFPFKGKLGGLMGVGVAANGDIWIADGTKNQLLHFPGGQVKAGKIVNVNGLKSPFGIAIDAHNRVFVSNSQSNTVLRFPADDPSKVETFKVGIGARGVALDSTGNLWVASLMSPDFPLPKIPDGVSIMEQFAMLLEALGKNMAEGKKTGIVSMIRPDGTQLAQEGFTGNETINGPWGIVVDGNDDVFVASGLGRGIVMLAGTGGKGHPAGTKPGDLIHFFQGGTIQIPTIGSIDPAGNLWVANNWNSVEAATAANPSGPTSTWGGGAGFTVVYGVAAPVKTPLLGQVRQP